MNGNTCAFIFARGGSKGVKRKNLREVGGQSLLARSIMHAREVVSREMVFVSTDDGEIANVATKMGVQVVWRDRSLASDTSPEWLSWKHAISTVQGSGIPVDIFLSIPTTAPLRETADIHKCLEFCDDSNDCVVTVAESSVHPQFNLVRRDFLGYVELESRHQPAVSRRQDSGTSYFVTPVAYAAHAEFVLRNRSLWDGRVGSIVIPQERSLDIDTEWDLYLADLILSDRLRSRKFGA